jgi:hypothetical protein
MIPKLFEEMICNEITTNYPATDFCHAAWFHEGPFNCSNFVIDKIENGHQGDGVYTDFSKAFDQVNHGLLCFDLMRSFSGMRLAWFRSYLTGHTQRVRLDDFLSDVIYFHSGVPQGAAILGLYFSFIM